MIHFDDVRLSHARQRLQAAGREADATARRLGRLAGVRWAEHHATPEDLVAACGFEPDEDASSGDEQWAAAVREMPSLAAYVDGLDDGRSEFARYLRVRPMPLLLGFLEGARELSDALHSPEWA